MGVVTANAGDVNGDGFDDILVGDQYRPFLLLGPLHGQGLVESESVFTFNPPDGEPAYLGQRLSGAGDVNGDGFSDIIIGSIDEYVHYDDLQNEAFVLLGPVEGDYVSPDADVVLSGLPDQSMGAHVSEAGDVNGDGFDDLLVGTSYYSTYLDAPSGIYVVHGPPRGDVAVPEQAAAHLDLGWAPSEAGDVNGDGFDDVLIGLAFLRAGEGDYEDVAYLLHGPVEGSLDWEDSPDVDATFLQTDGRLFDVDGGGDVNGDGYSDMLFGNLAAEVDGEAWGRAHLVYGSTTTGTTALADADASFTGEDFDHAGQSVDVAGDIDGDGFDDLLIGAPDAARLDGERAGSGRAYLLYGPVEGAWSLADADAILVGEHSDWEVSAGYSVSGTGDFNADGLADLLIGAPRWGVLDDEGVPLGRTGKLYGVYGRER